MADPDFALLLKKYFGFDDFRPGQLEAIEGLWEHKAALAVFPTGGGKSLCYQLPALALDGVTLVVSPLIALMKDQIDFLRARGIAASRLDSSLNANDARAVIDRMRDGSLKILYVAPERFNNERFLASIKSIPIALFAVDEAHCISEWGHNFRPDYLKLADVARELKVERILALTATAPPTVVKDICAAFNIPPDASIVTGFYRPNLNVAMTPTTNEGRDALLLETLAGPKARPDDYLRHPAKDRRTGCEEFIGGGLSRAGVSCGPRIGSAFCRSRGVDGFGQRHRCRDDCVWNGY